jgi:type IV pilus assembly protein PilA
METTMSARLLRIARDALAKRAGAAEQEGAEAGFTLIELMVVLLIMAILLAIAIPTFLGVKGGAQDRAAQSNLTNALTSAKAVYASQGSYPAFAGAGGLSSTLATQEPELSFVAVTPTKGSSQLGTLVSADGQQLVLVGYSASGLCWALSDNDGTVTGDNYGSAPAGTEYTAWNPSLSGGTACSTAAFTAGTAISATAPNLGWSGTYPTGTPGGAP